MEVAQANPPSTTVPYAFEQRILARIRDAVPAADPWIAWARGLWRAAVPGMAMLALIAAWNWQTTGFGRPDTGFSADDLELAVVDAIDTPDAPDIQEGGL